MLARSKDALLNEAMRHLLAALQLLDRAEAPADIGAHIDHAGERIKAILSTLGRPAASPPTTCWD